ncbi:MAG: hypothetical protein AAF485_05650, partial [Chloroflexota bacterium]
MTVSAQPPKGISESQSFSPDNLATGGLSTDISISTVSTNSFDLEILKRSSAVSVTSGTLVTFTISITNHGPDVTTGAIFYDNIPTQMQNVAYLFNTGVVSNAEGRWLLNSISVNGTVAVTITGILTSAPNVSIIN